MTNFRLPHPTDPQRWPATCNLCGAPLMGGRCPRCGYERQKQGQAVLSGYTSGFPIEYIALGAAWAAGHSVAIANVAVPAGSMILSYTISVNDGSTAAPAVTTWNTITLTQRQPGGDGVRFTGIANAMVSQSGNATLTATNNDAAVTSVGVIAFALTNAAAYVTSTQINSGGTPSIAVGPVEKVNDIAAGRVSFAGIGIDVDTTDIATIVGLATKKQFLSLPDATSPSIAYHTFMQHNADVPAFTSGATIPVARDWYIDSSTVR